MSDQVIGQKMCVVTATRNSIDIRKWIASKLMPHQYGDQPTGVTVTNQSNVVLISEERQRELEAVRQRMIEQQKRWEGGHYPREDVGGSLAGRSRVDTGVHPIVPIMIGDAAKSQKFAGPMLEKGVYVIGFFYPVVPHATARVRTQRIRAKIWNLPSTPLPKQTKS